MVEADLNDLVGVIWSYIANVLHMHDKVTHFIC